MSHVQSFKTPSGEEMVVLSRAEYDELLAIAAEAAEDAEDAAIYAQRKADTASGANDPLPPEVSALIHRGDTRLKAVRCWRGLSQVDLAHAASIGQGHLSDIENRRRNLTADVAAKLAKKLEVPVDWLL